jgi:hypothetical protein
MKRVEMEEKWSARMIREEIVSALRLPPRVVIVSYGRFGTTYLSHPQVSRIQKKKKSGGFAYPDGRTDRLSQNVGTKLPVLPAQ